MTAITEGEVLERIADPILRGKVRALQQHAGPEGLLVAIFDPQVGKPLVVTGIVSENAPGEFLGQVFENALAEAQDAMNAVEFDASN